VAQALTYSAAGDSPSSPPSWYRIISVSHLQFLQAIVGQLHSSNDLWRGAAGCT